MVLAVVRATPAERGNFRIIGTGQGVHWPEVDEDLSVEGMPHGVPAHRPRSGVRGASQSAGGAQPTPGPGMRPTRDERRGKGGSRGARG